MEQNIQDVRHLPEIQMIAEYMKNMKFKRKVFGGVDTESVLDHFSQVSQQFEAIISAYAARSEKSAREMYELQARFAEYDQYYRDAIQWYEGKTAWLQAQNDQLQQQAAALWAQEEQRRWAYAPQQ